MNGVPFVLPDLGDAVFALQILQEIDDLGLHADIERADRLVAHNESRRWRCPPLNSCG